MEGARLRAGAVGALPPFPNPISIARAALEDGRHVLYVGEGAERFAAERGFVRSTSEAMTTEFARARWLATRATTYQSHETREASPPLGASAAGRAEEPDDTGVTGDGASDKAGTVRGNVGGTVGAVARDSRGSVAAATSTGGRTNKRAGRVGDSPVLGAGTYADDDAGACSATGDGEVILRVCLARGAIDLLRGRVPPEEASRAVLRAMTQRVGPSAAGLILVDRFGLIGFARTTRNMTWAAAGESLDPTSGA
jgi:beta-aspartyl-peptidase (threonine type)